MGKKISIQLLYNIQCLYQQRLITNAEKTMLVKELRKAMESNHYQSYKETLITLKDSNKKKKTLIEEAIEIIEKGR